MSVFTLKKKNVYIILQAKLACYYYVIILFPTVSTYAMLFKGVKFFSLHGFPVAASELIFVK